MVDQKGKNFARLQHTVLNTEGTWSQTVQNKGSYHSLFAVPSFALTYPVYTLSSISLCSCLSLCLSVCLYVGLLVSLPSASLHILLFSIPHHIFYPSSYFLSGQLSEGHQGYYLDMRYTMSALGLSLSLALSLYPTSSPCSLFLYQVISVLISGHLGCRVTEGPVGIKWSICIIGILALFISFPCVCVATHMCCCIPTCVSCMYMSAWTHQRYLTFFFPFLP